MLTKEDYMKLPKERLAELLVERDNISIPSVYTPYNQQPLLCNGEICVNPHHDCINCPRHNGTSGVITTTNASINTNKE